jgi:hypothetical protein
MKTKITFIHLLAFAQLTQAEGKHHYFGIERGLMDGLALHFAPWKLDFAISYGLLFVPDGYGFGGFPPTSYTSKTTVTQTAARVGIYYNEYGESSFYVNAFAGQWAIKQTRSGDALGSRTAETTATFIIPGAGYHWFWENFNLRLGLASGPLNVSSVDYRSSSGAVVQQGNLDVVGYAGGLDLAIGWAF